MSSSARIRCIFCKRVDFKTQQGLLQHQQLDRECLQQQHLTSQKRELPLDKQRAHLPSKIKGTAAQRSRKVPVVTHPVAYDSDNGGSFGAMEDDDDDDDDDEPPPLQKNVRTTTLPVYKDKVNLIYYKAQDIVLELLTDPRFSD